MQGYQEAGMHDASATPYNDEIITNGMPITEIRIWHREYIEGIETNYNGITTGAHQGKNVASSSKIDTLKLGPNEYIQSITGRCGAWLDSMTITTTNGRSMKCGFSSGGHEFSMYAAGLVVINLKFEVGNYVNYIAANFGYPMPTGFQEMSHPATYPMPGQMPYPMPGQQNYPMPGQPNRSMSGPMPYPMPQPMPGGPGVVPMPLPTYPYSPQPAPQYGTMPASGYPINPMPGQPAVPGQPFDPMPMPMPSSPALGQPSLTSKVGCVQKGSKSFDDFKDVVSPMMSQGCIPGIAYIKIWSASSLVVGLEIKYSFTFPDGRMEYKTTKHIGSEKGFFSLYEELEIKPNEYIVTMKGRSGSLIDRIEFITNASTSARAGGSGGSEFEFGMPTGKRIIAFIGDISNYLNDIAAYYL